MESAVRAIERAAKKRRRTDREETVRVEEESEGSTPKPYSRRLPTISEANGSFKALKHAVMVYCLTAGSAMQKQAGNQINEK